MRVRVLFSVLAGLVCSVPLATGGSLGVRPSALDSLRSGELVVLDAQQGLFVLSPATGQVRTLVAGFGLYEAMDMASAVLDGSDAIFVTMSAKGGDRAQLVRYNAAGARIGAWAAPRPDTRLSGIAVDAKKNVVYVASTQPSEIFTLDLNRSPRGGLLVRLVRALGADRLGAMVLDSRRDRLLVGDPYLGRVVAYDLASGRSQLLFEKVGEVAALALDAGRDRLFIADGGGERVLVADLADKPAVPRIFVQSKELDEPLGLALDAAGGLWVGDRSARKVYQVSANGQLLRALPLRPAPLRAVAGKAPR